LRTGSTNYPKNVKLVKYTNKINKLFVDRWDGKEYSAAEGRRIPMTKETPRTAKDQKPTTRPSHERVIENLDKWANSPGLQPPR
jgi:hypothetical protein